MISILLAPPVIITNRLDVAFGRRAEPGVLIGGGKADAVQPVDLVAIGDALALGIDILPLAPPAPSCDPWPGVIDLAAHGGETFLSSLNSTRLHSRHYSP